MASARRCQRLGRGFESRRRLWLLPEVAFGKVTVRFRWGYQASNGRLVRESPQTRLGHFDDPLATGSTPGNLIKRAWLELVYAYGSDPYVLADMRVRISPRALWSDGTRGLWHRVASAEGSNRPRGFESRSLLHGGFA